MNKLTQTNNTYKFNNTKSFESLGTLKDTSIKRAFDFAYNMSFGGKGEHRHNRSGGDINRKNGEIFINTFQGKLSEFGIYNIFHKNKLILESPDLETYELGKWDKYDFKINNKEIAVKSTKAFGNLLLLETKDWTKNGEYIPNLNTDNSLYDYFILVRIKADSDKKDLRYIKDGETIMKKNKLLYSQKADKKTLENLITSFKWSYDIPGYITHEDLVYLINNKFILPKKSVLGKNTVMDAENYYVQTGDMHDIDDIFNVLR